MTKSAAQHRLHRTRLRPAKLVAQLQNKIMPNYGRRAVAHPTFTNTSVMCSILKLACNKQSF